MAKMIPNIPENYDFNKSYGERKVYYSLKQLPKEFVVFHSIEWREIKRGRLQSGESDIIIFDPRYGILVIEVKSGGVYYENGTWYQTNLATYKTKKLDRSPLDQADSTKYALIKRFKEYNINIQIHSAIWLTSVSKQKMSVEDFRLREGSIFWKEDLDNPESALKRCFEYYGVYEIGYDKELRKDVIDLVAPTFKAIPTGKDIIEVNESNFALMTSEQIRILDFLVEQQEAAIMGSAGTGKTILAVEKAKKLSRKGKVLLLCFNLFLIDDLEERVSSYNIEVHNLHTLIKKYHDNSKDHFTDEEITNFLYDYPTEKWPFKHIVIDEGQDINPDHVLLLKLINEINESGFFYIFYDENQRVQQREGLTWRKEVPCQLVLSINCRNTRNIAATSHSVLDLKNINVKSDIEGEKPTLFKLESKEALIIALEELIDKYREAGFQREDITILTYKTLEKTLLKDVVKIGRYSLNREERNNQSIFFTTSRKFKGLETNILILIDLDKEAFTTDEQNRLFYVATSRAKVHLDLFFIGNDAEYKIFAHKYIKDETKYLNRDLSEKLNVKVI